MRFNQVISNTLKTWYQFRWHFKFAATLSSGPSNNNHLYPPSLSDSTFTVRYEKCVAQYKLLDVDGIFDSFATLSSLFGLPVTHLFHDFQTRNFKYFSNFPLLSPEQQ